jgi:hypothetical protein
MKGTIAFIFGFVSFIVLCICGVFISLVIIGSNLPPTSSPPTRNPASGISVSTKTPNNPDHLTNTPRNPKSTATAAEQVIDSD